MYRELQFDAARKKLIDSLSEDLDHAQRDVAFDSRSQAGADHAAGHHCRIRCGER